MKQWIRCLASFLVICLLVSTVAVSAAAAPLTFTDKYGIWTYQLESDGSVTILGCKNAKKNVVIPSELDGKPVKKLGDGLFRNNDTITAVVIPHGVEKIGANVFSGCDKLEQINLPASLVSIGAEAFAECSKLTSLYIPSSIKEIGDGAFKGNPQLHVTCAIDSVAAEYLEKNRTELGSYTLLKVTPTKQEPQENVTEAPVIKGKLVTYTFGKTINGKREYTLVVADSMPDLDLADFLIKDGVYTFEEQLYKLMGNRFQLVSLSHFDGTTTQELDCNAQNVVLSAYPGVNQYTENGETLFELEYRLSISLEEGELSTFPYNILFTAGNELVAYSVNDFAVNASTVKEDKQYTKYLRYDESITHFQSDGTKTAFWDMGRVSAHRTGVKGSCVEISISYSNQNTVKNVNEAQTKSVNAYDADTKTTVSANKTNSRHQWLDESIETRIYSSYSKAEDDICLESKQLDKCYDEGGTLTTIYQYSTLPGTEMGTYEKIDMDLGVIRTQDYQYENHWTDSNGNVVDTSTDYHSESYNDLEYSETIVRAENTSEAWDRTHADFPNDPDEHKYDVSERTIDSVDLHKWESTTTDLNTGDVTENSGSYKNEKLSDHTYVRDTGKYVGWDWSWDYDVVEERTTLTSYTVTEYTYTNTAEGEVWTKTTVCVSPTTDSEGSYDFKTTFPEELLDDYNMTSSSYVFDDSLDSESGMDHWQETEYARVYTYESEDESQTVNQHYTNESENIQLDVTNGDSWSDGEPLSQEEAELLEQKLEAAEAIVMGNTTVTAGEETLSQEESKEDLLKLMEELKDPANYKEDYFEEVLEEYVPDGEEILAELEKGTLPESNVDNHEDIQCPNHSTSVAESAAEPVVTLAAESAAAPAAESAAAPVSEPAAAPTAEPTTAPATDITIESGDVV